MTKQETTYLKGWAVLFMMFLHFGCGFVMPEYRYSWCGNDYAGAFQICVPIFLFLSGYGLMAGSMNKGFAVFDSFKKQFLLTRDKESSWTSITNNGEQLYKLIYDTLSSLYNFK